MELQKSLLDYKQDTFQNTVSSCHVQHPPYPFTTLTPPLFSITYNNHNSTINALDWQNTEWNNIFKNIKKQQEKKEY